VRRCSVTCDISKKILPNVSLLVLGSTKWPTRLRLQRPCRRWNLFAHIADHRQDERHAHGRAIGILIADVSDGAAIKKIKKAATKAGASVKIIAPKASGAKLADGSMLATDGQLAGMSSVLFDAVAVILSEEGAKALSMEGAAIDFVRDAFGHLKAIAVDKGGRMLLKIKMRASWMPTTETPLLLRQRRDYGSGKN
jgi:hypothetical protein